MLFMPENHLCLEQAYVNGELKGQYGYTVAMPVPATDDGILVSANNMILNSCRLADSGQQLSQEELSVPYGKVINAAEDNENAVFDLGWYDKEGWGLWSKPGLCYLPLILADSSGEDIRVDMDVVALPQPEGLAVEIVCKNDVLFNQSIKGSGKIHR